MRPCDRGRSMAAMLLCAMACLTCFSAARAAQVGCPAPSVALQSNAPAGVPDFVIRHAPLVYMDPQERYMPSDIGSLILNTTPKLDGKTGIQPPPSSLTLDNLDQLNGVGDGGVRVYLTSNDDVTKEPSWIFGTTPNAEGKTENAVASAVIVADKGNGVVDAFYFYFNNFDYGGDVLGQNLGNHIGDWEHTMVRFQDGAPQAMWFSQHSGGQSFSFPAVMKDDSKLRPIVFSARGSHANYGLPGTHDHTIATGIPGFNLPGQGLLTDYTGYGALWDPIKSAYWYTYTGPTGSTQDSSRTRKDSQLGTFRAYDEKTPVGWLYYQGRWGDQQYPESDPRQKKFFGFYRYTTGPNGPAFKNLTRTNIWPGAVGAVSPVLLPRSAKPTSEAS